MARIKFVRQIGHTGECARTGCGKGAQYRVILGSWDVDAYTCTGHVAWAVNLDLITQSVGKAMGWESRQSGRPAEVIPELGVVKRTDFGRDVASQIATVFPYYNEGSDIPQFRP